MNYVIAAPEVILTHPPDGAMVCSAPAMIRSRPHLPLQRLTGILLGRMGRIGAMATVAGVLAATVRAQSWKGTTDGNWTNSSNWTATYPNASSATATAIACDTS